MAYFKVTVNDAGLELPVEGSEHPIRGFFQTHIVRARDAEHAAQVALEAAHSAWADRQAAVLCSGPFPVLSVESISSASLTERIALNPKGYTFYRSEGKH